MFRKLLPPSPPYVHDRLRRGRCVPEPPDHHRRALRAGGETDLVARMLADGMAELKQVMVVQNIVGASGVAGIARHRGQARRLYRRNPERAAGQHPTCAKFRIRWIVDFVGRILKAPRHGRQDRALEHA
ncbi:hypothetical protein [Bilophila wadsworthia]|uniref:hypothetical protein n=1 Tax=Bilophila wadsworthia TaxID=35833 RepID=UPI003990CD2A